MRCRQIERKSERVGDNVVVGGPRPSAAVGLAVASCASRASPASALQTARSGGGHHARSRGLPATSLLPASAQRGNGLRGCRLPVRQTAAYRPSAGPHQTAAPGKCWANVPRLPGCCRVPLPGPIPAHCSRQAAATVLLACLSRPARGRQSGGKCRNPPATWEPASAFGACAALPPRRPFFDVGVDDSPARAAPGSPRCAPRARV
jgi:hypothetical protein